MIKKFGQFINEGYFTLDFTEVANDIRGLLDKHNIDYTHTHYGANYPMQEDPVDSFEFTIKGKEGCIYIWYIDDIEDDGEMIQNLQVDVSGSFFDIEEDESSEKVYSINQLEQSILDRINTSEWILKLNESFDIEKYKGKFPVEEEDVSSLKAMIQISDILDHMGLNHNTHYSTDDYRWRVRINEPKVIYFSVVEYMDMTTDENFTVKIQTDEEVIETFEEFIEWLLDIFDLKTDKWIININENVSNCDFWEDRFNLSPYDDVFRLPLYFYIMKKMRGKIVYMTPDKFMRESANYDTTYEDNVSIVRDHGQERVKSLVDKMKSGIKIDLPFVMKMGDDTIGHEGRHRAWAAKSLGCDKIPVGVFEILSKEEVNEFIRENHDKSEEELNKIFSDMGYKKPVSQLGMNDLKRMYSFLKESRWIEDINLPFSKEWPDSLEGCDELVRNILDAFNIKYEYYLDRTFDLSSDNSQYSEFKLDEEYEFEEDCGQVSIFIYQDLNSSLNGEPRPSVYMVDDCEQPHLETTHEMVEYLGDIEAIDTSKWLININERMSEEQIMKNPNTTFDEKEDQIIRLRIQDLEKYKKLKSKVENMLEDIDEDINYVTLSKLIGGNPFLKQYVMLISKKRELNLLDLQIEQKQELIENLKKELSGTDNDQRRDTNNQIKEHEQEISDMENKKKEYSDIDNKIQKWDNQIIRITRDLKNGKSVLSSTLDYLR